MPSFHFVVRNFQVFGQGGGRYLEKWWALSDKVAGALGQGGGRSRTRWRALSDDWRVLSDDWRVLSDKPRICSKVCQAASDDASHPGDQILRHLTRLERKPHYYQPQQC